MTTTSKTSGGAAKAAPSTPAEAERLIRKVSTAEEAHQLYLFCAVKEASWRAVKLKALRRYGNSSEKRKTNPTPAAGIACSESTLSLPRSGARVAKPEKSPPFPRTYSTNTFASTLRRHR